MRCVCVCVCVFMCVCTYLPYYTATRTATNGGASCARVTISSAVILRHRRFSFEIAESNRLEQPRQRESNSQIVSAVLTAEGATHCKQRSPVLCCAADRLGFPQCEHSHCGLQCYSTLYGTHAVNTVQSKVYTAVLRALCGTQCSYTACSSAVIIGDSYRCSASSLSA